MPELNFTNPGEFKKNRKRSSRNLIDYKEAVAECLINLGIPLRVAEVAVIDMKQYWIDGHHNKADPMDVAKDMEQTVRKSYRVGQ